MFRSGAGAVLLSAPSEQSHTGAEPCQSLPQAHFPLGLRSSLVSRDSLRCHSSPAAPDAGIKPEKTSTCGLYASRARFFQRMAAGGKPGAEPGPLDSREFESLEFDYPCDI